MEDKKRKLIKTKEQCKQIKDWLLLIAVLPTFCSLPPLIAFAKEGNIGCIIAIPIVIVFAIIISIIRFCCVSEEELEELKEKQKQREETLNTFYEGIEKVAEYNIKTNDIIAVEHTYTVDMNGYVLLLSKNFKEIILTAKIPFGEIIDCKIYKDDEILGGVGRAVVGGILAGGVGAIVGSTTARKKVTNYKIAIIRNNIAEPLTEIHLISKETATYEEIYKQADDFATKVYASVMAIIANNQKQG